MEVKVNSHISLRPYNTFGIDSEALYFSTFNYVDQLQYLILKFSDQPLLILGGGSNILLTGNFNGLVAKNEIKGITIDDEDDDNVFITAGAGENWNDFVTFCVDNNYGGLENLALIPGNVGASPMQNIGAYGVEIKDVFHQLKAYDLHDGIIRTFNNEECSFGYRESIFKNEYKGRFVIMTVTFRLSKRPILNISYGAIGEELQKMGNAPLTIKKVSQAVRNIRKSKLPDPSQIGNAGSFFKNIEIDKNLFENLQSSFPAIPFFKLSDNKFKIPSAWLIEQYGWKGFRDGDVGCHQNQPLVLVNYGNANGQMVKDLSEKIIQSVNDKFKLQLEVEVNVI